MEEEIFKEEKPYNSASDFVNDFITGSKKDLLKPYIFRGESSSKYNILPSALRLNNHDNLCKQAGKGMSRLKLFPNEPDLEAEQIENEYKVLRRFFIEADNQGLPLPVVDRIRRDILQVDADAIKSKNEKWIPSDLRELAGLAQHYGIPTRLLDWTFDFFVALYFAASGVLQKFGKPDYDESDFMVIWALNAEFIDLMKPFEGVSKPLALDIPIVIVRPPYFSNPNLAAQKGVFSLLETDWYSFDQPEKYKRTVNRTPLDKLIISHKNQYKWGKPLLYKFMLPVGEGINLMKILDRIHYNTARLFPGYTGVAKLIQEQSILLRDY